MNKNLTKEIRLNPSLINIREKVEGEEEKMIVEGYPIVFDKEAFIGFDDWGWFEKVDRNAFENADMSDVVLRYNHNDLGFVILARTRNNSLQLSIDDKGVFMHAELIDTTTNRDIYKMVKSELLTEGSFAFTISDETEEIIDGKAHRTIKGVGKLFDVSICDNGAYGDLTEIYARSRELVETKLAKLENEKRAKANIQKLKNKNKLLLLRRKKINDN